jgi:hypothetical protein
MAPDCLVNIAAAKAWKPLAIRAIYNPRQGQVKNGEFAGFPEPPLFARWGTDI